MDLLFKAVNIVLDSIIHIKFKGNKNGILKSYKFNTLYKLGFYAEPKKFSSIKDGVEYVSRYCDRLCISENRIISYDGNNATFWCNAHEDEVYHEVTVSAYVFIKLILRHELSVFKTFNHNP